MGGEIPMERVKLVMSTCETHDQNSYAVGNTELQVKMKECGAFVIWPHAHCCGIYALHFPEITS